MRFLVVLSLLVLAPLGWAEASKPAILVEVFTSKYCPNCPAVEADLLGKAQKDKSFMLVMEHVDYWNDETAGRVDPDSLADFTQRQYDYSNTLGERPGAVFTPQPIMDGARVAAPPLFLSWGSKLSAAQSSNVKQALDVSFNAKGDVWVSIPDSVLPKNPEVWVMPLAPLSVDNAFVAKGLVQAKLAGSNATVAGALLPKAGRILVVVQESGLGKVTAFGVGVKN